MKRTKQNRSKSDQPKNMSKLFGRIEDGFFKAMRRPPQKHDRLFYWSYCYSDNEFKENTIKLMLHARIPQHLIYIYDKTGFMVNEQGYKRLSKKERDEIKQASLEYDEIEEENQGDIYKLADYDDLGLNEDDPLIQALYIFGNFIERNVNSGEYTISEQRFICGYLVVRAYRLVRAIFRSQKYTTTEETLVLVRSLYEIYCKLTYATRTKRNALYLLDSDFGLAFGDYEILSKDGKLKRHVLIHRKSGKTIPRTRSFYEYVSSSRLSEDKELFEVLYEYLSSFVHSGSRHIFRTWADNQKGFLLTHDNDENFKVFVTMMTCLISSMIMQSLLSLRNISSTSKWDISLYCYATRHIIMGSGTPAGSELSELFPRIKARAAVLPARVPRLKAKD